MSYNPDFPVVLGLAGEAATGKSVTASALAPQARFIADEDTGIYWNHLYFAMPLYRIANARQNITGDEAWSRQAYEVHDTLVEVFGRALPYEDLVEMVYDILHLPCEPAGTKPRSFLQYVGTEMCRAIDSDCWVNWMRRKVTLEFNSFYKENPNTELNFAVVISDVRFPNEAEFIAQHPNGVLVKLTCDPDEIARRIYDRDGVVMTSEQKAHASERSVDLIPQELFTHVLDTTDLSIDTQVETVRNIVNSALRGIDA